MSNERTIWGEQPYKHDCEEMARQEATVRAEAEEPGDSHEKEFGGDRRARMESDAEDRFEEIQEDRSER